jgi:hypothetical protein
MSKHNWLPVYAELEEPDNGITTLFRKFETGTWLIQYNSRNEQIGMVMVSEENMKKIQSAPALKVGDGTNIQILGDNS